MAIVHQKFILTLGLYMSKSCINLGVIIQYFERYNYYILRELN